MSVYQNHRALKFLGAQLSPEDFDMFLAMGTDLDPRDEKRKPLDTKIESLGFNVRAHTVLRNNNVMFLFDLRTMRGQGATIEVRLSRLRDCGKTTMDNIRQVVKDAGWTFDELDELCTT